MGWSVLHSQHLSSMEKWSPCCLHYTTYPDSTYIYTHMLTHTHTNFEPVKCFSASLLHFVLWTMSCKFYLENKHCSTSPGVRLYNTIWKTTAILQFYNNWKNLLLLRKSFTAQNVTMVVINLLSEREHYPVCGLYFSFFSVLFFSSAPGTCKFRMCVLLSLLCFLEGIEPGTSWPDMEPWWKGQSLHKFTSGWGESELLKDWDYEHILCAYPAVYTKWLLVITCQKWRVTCV